MRGLGNIQEKTKENNIKRILFIITRANANNRFCTISEIFKNLGLNHASIRNHLNELLDSKKIIEHPVYNGARGFATSFENKVLKRRKYFLKFHDNTESYIYKSKYPNLKSKYEKIVVKRDSKKYVVKVDKNKINRKTKKTIRKIHHLE